MLVERNDRVSPSRLHGLERKAENLQGSNKYFLWLALKFRGLPEDVGALAWHGAASTTTAMIMGFAGVAALILVALWLRSIWFGVLSHG